MIAPPAGLLRRSAEAFAAQGWHVLPTAGKVPRTKHGVDDATTDPALIGQWWTRWPTANIAVACGPSGLLVVDLDGPDATTAWRELAREHDLAPTRTARTGRPGGWHVYYSDAGSVDGPREMPDADAGPAPAVRVRNSAGRLAPGIDIRTAGGYVIAPPSLHESGALYTWHVPAGATRPLPVLDAPGWLLDTLTTLDVRGSGPTARAGMPGTPPAASQRYLDAAVRGEADRVAAAVEGTRNHTLNRAAFALAGLGIPEQVIRDHLARAAHGVGLDPREIDRTLTSGISAGHIHPASPRPSPGPGPPRRPPRPHHRRLPSPPGQSSTCRTAPHDPT